MIIEHCKKITASYVHSLGVRDPVGPGSSSSDPSGLNNSNGVSMDTVVKTPAGANFSSDVGHARLTKLLEGPETEVFDL